MIDASKQRLTSSPSGKEARQDAALQQLMEEMVAAKQAVQDVLKISPEDIQLHLIRGEFPAAEKGENILAGFKMQPHIKNGIIRFCRNQTQLIDQLRYFPKADHDDGPDALEMVFSLITHHTSFGPRIRSLLPGGGTC